MILVLFVLGLALLVGGAEILVRGASRLAAVVGISPLVVGLTVVAFGTSSPELAVSVQAALDGVGDIAIGNVVGSNIFNILFILGISAVITPLSVHAQVIRREVPLMILVSVALLLLALDGGLARLDGLLLFAGIVGYTSYSVIESRRASPDIQTEYAHEFAEEEERAHPHWAIDIGMIVGGLAMLVLGARWLVDGAVSFAEMLGVSEMIIGLTVIAAGTSLPEVATSVIASLRGERDIAVGNVVGSNIFNVLAVLGLAALVSPQPIAVSPSALSFDIPVMIAVAVASLPVFFVGSQIARWDGLLFLAYYAAYTLYLFLVATQDPVLPAFSTIMLAFVLPITAVTLVIIAAGEVRRRRAEKRG